MALEVKLEYVNVKEGDDGVMWHFRFDVPVYASRISKEEYLALDPADMDPFITGLFELDGIVEVSCKAYRVWAMKSPVYSWDEINDDLEEYFLTQFGETETEYLNGSAFKNGRGMRLTSEQSRRDL